MKSSVPKKLIYTFLLSFTLLFSFTLASVFAQDINGAHIKSMLASKNFIFRAQSAWPLQGTVVQLNAGFDSKVIGDSINTYLPYFGRTFNASYASQGGFNFVSTRFDYKLKEKVKGGWELEIRPTDTKEVTLMVYSVSTNGFATLQVLSNSRQAISFYGILEKHK